MMKSLEQLMIKSYVIESLLKSSFGVSTSGKNFEGERPISAKAFGKRFRKLVPDMPPAPNVKITPVDMRKQFNCFEVPNIEKCRDHFAAHQRLKHKTWEKADKFEMLGIDLLKWCKGW
jgi:hypothetical protein